MNFWEVVGLIAGGLVALNSALDALRGVTLAPVRIYRWLRRAIRAVDVILSIPTRLEKNETLLADHIRLSIPQVELLTRMAKDLGVIVPAVQEVHYQMHPNGGGSAVDRLARIEEAVNEQALTTGQHKFPAPAKRGSTRA